MIELAFTFNWSKNETLSIINRHTDYKTLKTDQSNLVGAYFVIFLVEVCAILHTQVIAFCYLAACSLFFIHSSPCVFAGECGLVLNRNNLYRVLKKAK